MKESSVLHFSTTKMAGHRQALKCQGLNLYGSIKATSLGAENSIWWSRKDTLAWSNLKIAHNSEQLLQNLHLSSFTNTLYNGLKHNIKPAPAWNYTDVKVYNRGSFLLYSKHESVLVLYLQTFYSIIRQFNFRRKMNKFVQGHAFWIINSQVLNNNMNSPIDTLDVQYNMLMTCS